MLDADSVINNSSQKVGGFNAYPDPAPEIVGGSGRRKIHRIYAPGWRSSSLAATCGTANLNNVAD